MSTLTTRLGIKKPPDPDPFLTSDFASNYDLIDSYPGVFVCTSTTLPTWTTAQAGQVVFLTDTKAFREWTGTAWQEPLVTPPAWELTASIGSSISGTQWPAAPTSATFSIGTFNSSRAGTAWVWHEELFLPFYPDNAVDVRATIAINGTNATGPSRYAQYATSSAWWYWTGSFTDFSAMNGAGFCPVAKGTNTVTVTFTYNGDTSGNWSGPGVLTHSTPSPAQFFQARMLAILCNTTAT